MTDVRPVDVQRVADWCTDQMCGDPDCRHIDCVLFAEAADLLWVFLRTLTNTD